MTRQRHSCLLACLIISACAAPPKVAVEERDVVTVRQETERMGGQLIRIVQPGDTLHSIAFSSGLDANKVAAWNGMQDTSRIFVGQRVRLTKPIGFEYPKAKTVMTPSVLIERSPEVVEQLQVPAKEAIGNAQRTPAQPPDNLPSSSVSTAELAWRWPTIGQVVGQFALSVGRQGIDIRAERGLDVRAAERGEVVYVGNSLKGYGNLIIVKHTEEFLSAYAHNESVFVSEGQAIDAQQKIGSVGVNNQRQSALHFQIRKNGTPVDPLLFLPKVSASLSPS